MKMWEVAILMAISMFCGMYIEAQLQSYARAKVAAETACDIAAFRAADAYKLDIPTHRRLSR